MDYNVIDNFFDEDFFIELQNTFVGDSSPIPWFLVNRINLEHKNPKSDNMLMFQHKIFEHEPLSDAYKNLFGIFSKLEIKALMRVKANCYPSTQTLIEHPAHADYPFEHKGAIIYINTCDGYTKLEDGTKIESVANRVLFFDPSKMHSSTNCTNAKARFNININYF